ncbi:hypothetical protein A2U01_0049397, partial [Trifolium medium]|nr:hypothetical protein [Trifolium medium]
MEPPWQPSLQKLPIVIVKKSAKAFSRMNRIGESENGKSEASFPRITGSSSCPDNPKFDDDAKQTDCTDSSEYNLDDSTEAAKDHH